MIQVDIQNRAIDALFAEGQLYIEIKVDIEKHSHRLKSSV